jgi:hypothetical protein
MQVERALAMLMVLSLGAGCGRSVQENDGQGGSGGAGSSSTVSAGKGTSSQSTGSQSTGSQSTGSQSTGSQSTGSQSTGATMTTGTGTMMCPGLGDACTGCMSGGCADVWCGCANNSDCLPIFQCWNACMPGDQACIQDCMVLHDDAVSAALLVSNCAAGACDGSCNWGHAIPPCTECIYTDCSTVMNECFVDAECVPLLDCIDGCPPMSVQCQQQCYAAHGAGVDPLQAVIDCADMACGSLCN